MERGKREEKDMQWWATMEKDNDVVGNDVKQSKGQNDVNNENGDGKGKERIGKEKKGSDGNGQRRYKKRRTIVRKHIKREER